MITRFSATNLKSFEDVSVSLAPLTVLVGANGAGKTTLLDGLYSLLRLLVWAPTPGEDLTRYFGWQLQEEFKGARALSQVLRAPDAQQMTLEVEYGEGSLNAQIEADSEGRLISGVMARDDWPLKLTYPSPQPVMNGTGPGLPQASQLSGDEWKRLAEGFYTAPEIQQLASVMRLRLDVAQMIQPSEATTSVPIVQPDGSGLPTILQYLAGERDGRLDAIEAGLRAIVPEFRRVRTPPTTVEVATTEILRINEQAISRPVTQKIPGYSLQLEFDKVGWIPAHHVSEGTLLALGLLTFLNTEPPRLVLIDDGERGLHPKAQQILVTLLRKLQEERPELQIVLTTHSPDLVDVCAPEEVRVFGRGPDGQVKIASLLDHPEGEKWLKLMRVGEFWSTVGEDWLGEVPR